MNLRGKVADIFEFNDFEGIDFVLFDSMFHFLKKDKVKEIGLIKRVIVKVKLKCLLIFRIQDIGKKIEILNEAIDHKKKLERLSDLRFQYAWHDQSSGHDSATDYRMIIAKR